MVKGNSHGVNHKERNSQMYRTIFIILLFVAILAAEEAVGQIKKPARDSYREPFRTYWGEKEGNAALPKGITGEYCKLTVSPKTLPDPLLRYRLHILPAEYESGNAYPLIVEALVNFNEVLNRRVQNMLDSNESRSLGVDADREKVNQLRFKAFPLYSHWNKGSYTTVTAEQEAALFEDLASADVFKLLDRASRKRYYDWSERYEPNGIATRLPNIHEFRYLIRYLQGKADWEIRNGKYEDAVKTIRIGYTLGNLLQNSTPSPFLVTLLIGISAVQGMHDQLQNLLNQPDAPNLYPALTQLHFSYATFLTTLYSEQQWLYPRFGHPDLYEKIDKATSEECKAILNDAFTELSLALDMTDVPQKMPLLVSGFCLAEYPFARQRLVDKGYTEEQIEALSTYQIVVPYFLEAIQRAYDLMYVSASFSPGESHTAIIFDDRYFYDDRSDPAKMYLSMLFPATQSADAAFRRQTQLIDRLKIVEAIRYYAAVHDGKLPQSLDEIKEVAVPKIDPITGKPYIYKAEGNTATIDYTRTTQAPSRIELKIGK
ncbi:hypothetical protein FACS189454_05560 [Planctomycetales bacterium]|nr:hypothetical protein FACS189454_05560 [Planctomycetales bacterium]